MIVYDFKEFAREADEESVPIKTYSVNVSKLSEQKQKDLKVESFPVFRLYESKGNFEEYKNVDVLGLHTWLATKGISKKPCHSFSPF